MKLINQQMAKFSNYLKILLEYQKILIDIYTTIWYMCAKPFVQQILVPFKICQLHTTGVSSVAG
jgi:hypothetical protein